MEALIALYRDTSSDSELDSHPPIAASDDNRSPPPSILPPSPIVTYSTLPIRPLDLTSQIVQIILKGVISSDCLRPSKIKDANGRRPNNPLYDKRTIYIPPNVFRMMSASQKQYGVSKVNIWIFLSFSKWYLSTAYRFAFVDCVALQFWVGSVTDHASCAALGDLLMQRAHKAYPVELAQFH
ncbi:hypothetical protein L2E82_45806 [Cichorium intybus]|uniref:Uncharacterized protein n=1 Tax=Cichorium intybus TaxID=13427 RepID=A0ACB8ZT36_CICIN|nr:hypothetical protein L2E82_45806 [Cichorium intybus]